MGEGGDIAMGEVVGRVQDLWRFPVKSMQGERLFEVDVTERGLLGDRAYALIDTDTERVVSAKSVRLFPDMLHCSARFIDPPVQGRPMPAVQITLPDGIEVRSDAGNCDRALSTFFKRDVSLRQSAPADFTIDQYHPDIEGADPGGNRDAVVSQKLGAALFASLGMDSPVPVGSFLDVFPVSVLTSSTLAHVSALRPQSRFDQRRFRMNVILETKGLGFIENDWVGHILGVGPVQFCVTMLDPRCVMTTLAQADLPKDADILRALVKNNRVTLGELGNFPCAGVYAAVGSSGTVRTGDPVMLN